MLNHYLRIAGRALVRYQFHAVVSFASLTLGFVCFIAANVLAGHLRSWDRQFPGAERIFTISTSGPHSRVDGLPLAPRHLATHLDSEFPEIEASTAMSGGADYNVSIDDVTEPMNVTFVEGNYFAVFPLPLRPPMADLTELPPDRVLITEEAARARFGTADVVGRPLIVAHRLDLTIGGVIAPLAGPNHLRSALKNADIVAPMSVWDALVDANDASIENWHDQSYRVFVRFSEGAPLAIGELNTRLAAFSERRVPVRYYLSGPHQPVFSFMPLEESGAANLRVVFGDINVTALLVFAGFLVLLVASLNYSNLVVAQLAQRSQEIGVQKVLGARRRQLVAQYSLESLLLAGGALLVGTAACAAILAGSKALGARGFHAGLLLDVELWLTAMAGLALITLVAGANPALRVTRNSLSSLLRPAGSGKGAHRLRAIMVGTQFAVSSALLILAVFIFNQNRTMTAVADEAMDDALVVLEELQPETANELDLIEAELRRDASVAATSRTANVPWELGEAETIALGLEPDPVGRWVALNRIGVGEGYFDAMQMPLLAGRVFDDIHAREVYPPTRELSAAPGPYSIIIDAATAARLGWDSPAQAVGQTLFTVYTPPVVPETLYVELTVVGVVGDRLLELAGLGYAPTHAFFYTPDQANHLLVRPGSGSVPAALGHIDSVWRRFYPDAPARPEFLDEIFARNYAVVGGLGNIISAFAVFSFLISTVGLIGMATFVTRLRRREVGIRKVLGASRSQVMRMLLAGFSKPVLIANLIAWPAGFALASAYLSIFYVRTPMTPLPFVLSLVLTVGVAVLAVLYQSRVSARLRPATVLNQE